MLRLFGILIVVSALLACGSDEEPANTANEESTNPTQNTNSDEAQLIIVEDDGETKTYSDKGITLTEIKTEDHSKATLSLKTTQFKEGRNDLEFDINNVEEPSIVYIANNYTVIKHKGKGLTTELIDGNNVFLVFLTDKNGIGIKSNEACLLKNAIIGDNENLFEMSQPHLFYHVSMASNLPVLDFYLMNTRLSAEGNKVKVTVNDAEFIVDKWAAYTIEGLNKEENIVRIQLIDDKGNSIDGPFNDSGDRLLLLKKNA